MFWTNEKWKRVCVESAPLQRRRINNDVHLSLRYFNGLFLCSRRIFSFRFSCQRRTNDSHLNWSGYFVRSFVCVVNCHELKQKGEMLNNLLHVPYLISYMNMNIGYSSEPAVLCYFRCRVLWHHVSFASSFRQFLKLLLTTNVLHVRHSPLVPIASIAVQRNGLRKHITACRHHIQWKNQLLGWEPGQPFWK